jgi:undecaprenyl-diphosphatase
MHPITVFIARDLIILPLLIVAYLFWTLNSKDRKKLLVLLLIGGVLSLVFAKIGAHFYSNPRPFFKDHVIPYFPASDYNGFPSDHTLLASFLGFSVLAYWRRAGYALLAIAVIIGWARVASGVHHFIDIVGSFVFTALASIITIRVVDYWQAKNYLKNQLRN